LLPPIWREAEKSRDIVEQFEIGMTQAWLEIRRSGSQHILSAAHVKAPRNNLRYLRDLAYFSVEMGLTEPLASITHEHEVTQKDSQSSFVNEELQFAHGCLALIQGNAEEARKLLEPLVRASTIQKRHHVMARVYESLGLWREAAAEYEVTLKGPMRFVVFTPVYFLNRFRVAQVYERLDNPDRARHWYERFLTDWKDADPDIPELIEAKKRMAALGEVETVGTQ